VQGFLGRYSSYIYALLRIASGLIFFMHGTQKLFGWPLALPMPSNTMFTVIGVFEVIAGLMILLGFLASIPAFIASGMLAVGYFMVHQPMGAFPIQNGGEPAALLSFIFLYIAAHGSGIWSIDSLRGTSAASDSA
jgi:putative oxidoreductase